MVRPSGANDTDSTHPRPPNCGTGSPSRASDRPVAASHRRIVPSSPPDASVRPSGEYTSANRSSVWPDSFARSAPVATSRRITSCRFVAASVLPSGANATGPTPWWPTTVPVSLCASSLPVAAYQKRSSSGLMVSRRTFGSGCGVGGWLTDSSVLPSGVNRTCEIRRCWSSAGVARRSLPSSVRSYSFTVW